MHMLDKLFNALAGVLSLHQGLCLVQHGTEFLCLSVEEAVGIATDLFHAAFDGGAKLYRLPGPDDTMMRATPVSAQAVATEAAKAEPGSAFAAVAQIAANIRSPIEATESYSDLYGVDLTPFRGDQILHATAEYFLRYAVAEE